MKTALLVLGGLVIQAAMLWLALWMAGIIMTIVVINNPKC